MMLDLVDDVVFSYQENGNSHVRYRIDDTWYYINFHKLKKGIQIYESLRWRSYAID